MQIFFRGKDGISRLNRLLEESNRLLNGSRSIAIPAIAAFNRLEQLRAQKHDLQERRPLIFTDDRSGAHDCDGRSRNLALANRPRADLHRHERLHLTVKTEATRPPSTNVLQQQARFDTFIHQFNHERPHQALEMATPASRYQPSARTYEGLEELEYPRHDWTAVITTCGRICYQRRKVNVSQVFAGQKVGVTQTDDHIWLVTFMDYDLGDFDDETCRLEPIDNPFGSKLLPMSPE